eukprot:3462304-Rhodomonas_salina.1
MTTMMMMLMLCSESVRAALDGVEQGGQALGLGLKKAESDCMPLVLPRPPFPSAPPPKTDAPSPQTGLCRVKKGTHHCQKGTHRRRKRMRRREKQKKKVMRRKEEAVRDVCYLAPILSALLCASFAFLTVGGPSAAPRCPSVRG